eukprot:TRINITY_DN6615_c0_g1_i1.p1 TRINITY_DN6615_c0_g1~~TRINITY_DN6615_c0_g1_i1.p1  ORF type:complete len:379 (-),score=65.26 TRINITY_DN6615_c0_g1_i1:40-1176(-)
MKESKDNIKNSQGEMKKSTKKRERNLLMWPYILKGHQRPITRVKFNYDGDLLFTAAKDPHVCVWSSRTGELIGTFQQKNAGPKPAGHEGAIPDFDITRDSNLLITASQDESVRLWRVETGETLFVWPTSGQRGQSVSFNYGETQFFVAVNISSTEPGRISIFDFNKQQPGAQKATPVKTIIMDRISALSQTIWGYLNKTLITATEDGFITVHDPESGKKIKEWRAHDGGINSLSLSKDQSFFITSSDDFTSRLYDSTTFKCLKLYETRHPVNTAVLSSVKDHVLLGGGQKAMGAAMGGSDTAQFATRFYHTIDEEQLGNVKGHFGPINTIDIDRTGKIFASGGEEGIVRLHHLTDDYFEGALEEAADQDLKDLATQVW